LGGWIPRHTDAIRTSRCGHYVDWRCRNINCNIKRVKIIYNLPRNLPDPVMSWPNLLKHRITPVLLYTFVPLSSGSETSPNGFYWPLFIFLHIWFSSRNKYIILIFNYNSNLYRCVQINMN
jgi:hypothetical protein